VRCLGGMTGTLPLVLGGVTYPTGCALLWWYDGHIAAGVGCGQLPGVWRAARPGGLSEGSLPHHRAATTPWGGGLGDRQGATMVHIGRPLKQKAALYKIYLQFFLCCMNVEISVIPE